MTLADRNIDIDRRTGANIGGWPSVSQAIIEGIVTRFGSRVQREYYGCLVPEALGRRMRPETVLAIATSVGAFLDVFEPRFDVVQVTPSKVDRAGNLKITIIGIYRPNAAFGDDTPDGERSVTIPIAG